MSAPRVVLALDGNSIVHRAFHARAGTGFRGAAGRPRWAVRGLLEQLVAAVDRVDPDHVVVGFDDPDASVRRERWPGYKAHRADKAAALVEQLADAAATLRELGVQVEVPAGWEADDVLASVARRTPDGGRTVLVTSDRDAFELIDGRTHLLRLIDGGVEASPLLTPDRLALLLGVRPEQYRDLAALRGDPSDNLPGVPGVGPRTAARLLTELDSAEAAFADLDGGGARVLCAVGRAATNRLGTPEARARWAHNRQVMAMREDLPIDLGGPLGRLPLAAEAVRAEFRRAGLVWTARAALRALAHDESVPTPPPPAEPPWSPRPPRRARHPRLPARPRDDQLALF